MADYKIRRATAISIAQITKGKVLTMKNMLDMNKRKWSRVCSIQKKTLTLLVSQDGRIRLTGKQ